MQSLSFAPGNFETVSKVAEYLKGIFDKVYIALLEFAKYIQSLPLSAYCTAKDFVYEHAISVAMLKIVLLIVGILYLVYLVDRKISFLQTQKLGNNSSFLFFVQYFVYSISGYLFNILIKLNIRVLESLMISKYSEVFWNKYADVKEKFFPASQTDKKLYKATSESLSIAFTVFQVIASAFVIMVVIHIIFSVLNGELLVNKFTKVCNNSMDDVFASILAFFVAIGNVVKTFLVSIYYGLKISIKME